MREKRKSKVSELAAKRLAGITSIDVNLDMGDGRSAAEYKKLIDDTDTELAKYNTLMSNLDGQLNTVEEFEGRLNELSARMLSGIKSKFGSDSTEYEKAGGTRKSERKKPKPKVVTIP